jgi:class 3 adenylate cyclase/tetratricopeptide (TPR) repeat protein
MRSCTGCAAPLSAQARFCSQCGAPVDSAAATPQRVSGERRQLTVMFCDLVGSTELSHRLDPEELHEVIAAYQRACVRPVEQFGGHVARYLGDGVLVYFGFPLAQEDAAERALRAALEIRAALAELNDRRTHAGAEAISARIGIHTGQVVVTEAADEAHQETFGAALNVAARLQASAEPGGINVSEATLRLVPGLFRTRDVGTPELKGVTQPIRVHVLEGTLASGPRFHGRGSPTSLRGRDAELLHLLGCWRHAVEGRGQVVLVSGEAGIGKSRLVHSVGQRIADSPHFSLELCCSPYTQGSAFQPLIELLEHDLGFVDDDPPALRLGKLEDWLGGMPGLELARVVPYLALLLGLPESERFPLAHIGPELQRELTLEAVAAPIIALARQQPVLLLCEDLHWGDPSTLEVLGRLISKVASLHVLLLLTFRKEFAPPWGKRPGMSALVLERLSRENTLEVVRGAIESASGLSSEVIELLVERADGVPLFAEELTRSVVEAGVPARPGAPRATHLQIPSTLQDSLMARLDRLGSGKQVAQLAAVLGRTFSYALIEAVSELDLDALHDGLSRLVDAEILYRSGEPPRCFYTFKHALLQDTAYESLLRTRRRALHTRVAITLRERFPQRAAAEPEVVARHCAAAGLVPEAIEAYRQAGDQAAARLAYQEAQSYFAQALELLSTLPDDAARRTTEIDLRLAQAAPLGALRGYEDPELMAAIERVDELLAAIGTGPQQIPGLLKLAVLHTNKLRRARAYADALLSVVEPLGLAPLQMAGYILRGTGAIVCATVPEACADLRRALEIAETVELPAPKTAFEIDALAMGCSTYAIALVLAGRPDSAAALVERGVRRARELAHPRTQASALQIGATAFHLAEDARRVGELSGQCIEVVDGRGFHHVEVMARVLASWARARQGDHGATDAMHEALRSAERHGVVAGMPLLCFASADAHLLAGEHARALEQVARGEQFFEQSGERLRYEPQAAWMRARVLLNAHGDPDEVQSLLLRAVALWEQTQSPWMLLSAATLLGRVALETGKRRDEARERLARLYAAFDEGFDTERLRDARAMLDRLTGAE